ncbi:hypothetical protein EDD18DRAFT_35496 [Armillaria luteobubalina]|uniref:Uncharacterized protein n=1 Tax=Armillaria luteobubalina TaxID=153913 RepID=A0AA39QR27_9AGAR|nr:hypothetical protein EDD18DRAFT_35496 [Armillaria luteobubalina]
MSTFPRSSSPGPFPEMANMPSHAFFTRLTRLLPLPDMANAETHKNLKLRNVCLHSILFEQITFHCDYGTCSSRLQVHLILISSTIAMISAAPSSFILTYALVSRLLLFQHKRGKRRHTAWLGYLLYTRIHYQIRGSSLSRTARLPGRSKINHSNSRHGPPLRLSWLSSIVP